VRWLYPPFHRVFMYFFFNFIFLFLSVRVADGKLYHPDGAWDPDTIYVTVYSKRKLRILEKRLIIISI
jgi:hypothetical protein